jgi:uncharacterized protein YjbI with pentapeptide repeats
VRREVRPEVFRDGPYRREMMSAMTLPNGRRADEGARPKWRPISFWPWTLAAAAAVVVVAVGVTMWLLTIAGHAKPGTDSVNARLDAIRTGLAAGAGAGAAVGLMLAFRRQHHQEIATDLTDRDATERRITELYTKAVEQLGNDKAPVRLGGLYALERLAQDNSAHRQTIIDVICAYLRMPFSVTGLASNPEPETTEDLGEHGTQPETATDRNGDTWRQELQERQVRLTAQRILAEHLRDDRNADHRCVGQPGPRFWPGIRLDLTGATLIHLSFHRVVATDVRFDEATFIGTAQFYEATFTGFASFHGATFDGEAAFSRAAFGGRADFRSSTFAEKAWFSQATFGYDVEFNDATFCRDATFYGTIFDGIAEFQPVIFHGDATFHGTTFDGCAWFNGVTFAGRAGFGGATFADDTAFYGTTFDGAIDFGGVTFADGAGRLPFKGTRVLSPAGPHAWPPGWCLVPDRRGGFLVARAKHDVARANKTS